MRADCKIYKKASNGLNINLVRGFFAEEQHWWYKLHSVYKIFYIFCLTYIVKCDMILQNKGIDGECISVEPMREMAVGASQGGFDVFVAPEPEGRKRFASRTFP